MLRPYQVTVFGQLREALMCYRAALLVMACGAGKGTVICEMIERGLQKGKRITFSVHGKNLVEDMSQRVTKLGIPHGVLMGGKKREHWHAVQVASIDTLHRMDNPPHADLLIADEADTCMSPTWLKVLDGPYRNSKLVGMTATPIRTDGKPLGRQSGGLFDVMVIGPTERQLIASNYLVRSLVLAPPPPSDLNNVNLGGNDALKKQAAISDKPRVIGNIVQHWRKHALWQKTSAYGVDTHHANSIAEAFKSDGIQWAYVDADTPMDVRAGIWKDLDDPHSGLMGISSVGCTSVGWDHPIVSCLILARKTASLRLHRQILGRGSRTHESKTHFLVLDHVGNTHLHHPYGMFEDEVPWQLEGEPIKPNEPGDKIEPIATCKTAVMVDGTLMRPCYATFKAGPTKCPYCGIPIIAKAVKVQEVEGELGYLNKEDEFAARERNERVMRALYDSLHKKFSKVAEDNGYKPGYAYHAAQATFKRRYGTLPPPDWRFGG